MQPNGLPRILCLHGGGSSAAIFSFQVRKIKKALAPSFHLVFVNGPWECLAGPGILPVFEGAGPFYRWAPKEDGETYDTVVATVTQAMDADGGRFVGVLGFSQGAKLAAGLMGYQEEGHTLGRHVFGFSVVVNGSYPPLCPSVGGTGIVGAAYGFDEKLEGAIQAPSVHIWGSLDPVLPMSRLLTRCFSQETRVVLEFENGHYMPVALGDTDKFADAILTIHDDLEWGGGKEAVGSSG
jgi:pimeloyl-ACP methyl ester carboxylesterase